jgi:hypothetical protein
MPRQGDFEGSGCLSGFRLHSVQLTRFLYATLFLYTTLLLEKFKSLGVQLSGRVPIMIRS